MYFPHRKWKCGYELNIYLYKNRLKGWHRTSTNGFIVLSEFDVKSLHFILSSRSTLDPPDPAKNCSAYNATAYSMQIACVPGKDGGIRQQFGVLVSNFYPFSWGNCA